MVWVWGSWGCCKGFWVIWVEGVVMVETCRSTAVASWMHCGCYRIFFQDLFWHTQMDRRTQMDILWQTLDRRTKLSFGQLCISHHFLFVQRPVLGSVETLGDPRGSLASDVIQITVQWSGVPSEEEWWISWCTEDSTQIVMSSKMAGTVATVMSQTEKSPINVVLQRTHRKSQSVVLPFYYLMSIFFVVWIGNGAALDRWRFLVETSAFLH